MKCVYQESKVVPSTTLRSSFWPLGGEWTHGLIQGKVLVPEYTDDGSTPAIIILSYAPCSAGAERTGQKAFETLFHRPEYIIGSSLAPMVRECIALVDHWVEKYREEGRP